MYTVILVDDEPWAIQSLENTLPWAEYGFTVKGRYTNAMEAWQAILQNTPAVVFIDIRMPDITGLEILQKSREEGLDTIFVMVSGHEEFEYVHKAMRFGAFDYCLKPVEINKGRSLLAEISEKLSKNAYLRYAMLCECIIGRTNPDFVFGCFRQQHGGYWQVAILRHVPEAAELMVYNAVSGLHYLPMRMGTRKLMLIFNGREGLENEIKRALLPLTSYGISIGSSQASTDRDRIISLISQAQSGSVSDFIWPEPRFVHYCEKENQDINICAKAVGDAIETCSIENFIEALHNLRGIVANQPVQPWHLIVFWNSIMDVFRCKSKPGLFTDSLLRISEPDDLRHYLWDFDNMCKTLSTIMNEFVNEYFGIRAEYVNNSFMALLEYVNNNYHQRGLRLTELAESFHLNLTYCSELFRKVTGMTYTEYLTQLRMKHALESIRTGNTNLQQLSYDIGYSDYFTFSKRFKQYHGAPPSKFVSP